MAKQKPLTITAENKDVKVRVSIEVLKADRLEPEEATIMEHDIADGVMSNLSRTRFLNAPIVTQKVRGL